MIRYPVFVPSRGRFDERKALTVKTLVADGVPFTLVVEQDEADQYRQLLDALDARRVGGIDALPGSGEGSSVYARNHIAERAEREGVERYWTLDDNILHFARVHRQRRLRCDATALRVCEDFTDRYENVAVSGLAYLHDVRPGSRPEVPFRLNCHVYSCMLIATAPGLRFRGRRNEDTDLCLQALAAGYCTVQLVAFMIRKAQTMTMRGGNTDVLYDADGRLAMARELERRWPGVVSVTRRWGRPQHYVAWDRFDTPLRRRADFVEPSGPDDYGLRLRATREVQSGALRALVDDGGDAAALHGREPRG